MTFILALLGGLAGAILGWAAAAFAALGISGYLGGSDLEGARAMGAMFGIGPIGGLVGLIGGIWLVLRARGVKGFKATAIRMPIVIATIAGLVALTFWVLYSMSPILNPEGAAPKLAFEIRLPPGVPAPAGDDTTITLFTEKNSMPGTIDTAASRMDGNRAVLSGSVELYYRSSWRILELESPNTPKQIFVLRLGARPGRDTDFRGWEHVSSVGNGTPKPRLATADDAYDIRYRVDWPD